MNAISQFFYSVFKRIFKTQFSTECQRIIRDVENNLRKRYDETVRQADAFELSTFIDTPVIVVSNEWETPIIGFGIRVEYITQGKTPILIVLNYLDRKEYMCMGNVYHYTDQRFDVLFKLTPFELCSFIYGRYCMTEFKKEIREQILGKEEIQKLLDQNGFYQKLVEFNQRETLDDHHPGDAANQDAVT